MSKPFSYEIDERRLRLQLRSLETPFKEESWSKFESFSSSHLPVETQKRFKTIELNLNRNIVLPVIFGLLICIFSFLLFNFISIKKPFEQRTQVVLDSPEPVRSTALPEPPLIPNPTQRAAQNPQMAALTDQAGNVAEIHETPVSANSITENSNKGEVKGPSPAANNPVQVDKTQQPQTERKRKHRSDSEQQLSDIRPSLVSDEEVTEVLPD